jgi:hypothetical protein
VKCPSCATVFTAAEAPEEEEEKTPPPRPKKRPAPPPPEEDGDEPVDEEPEEEEERPRKKKRRPADEDDEEEEDERPRRRKKRGGSKAAARARVAAPGTCLMVVGGLGIGLVLIALVLNVVGAMAGGGGGQQFGPRPGGPEFEAGQKAGYVIGTIVGCLISICLQATIFTAGLKMKNLESRGLALTGSILALICSPCCIGLPFGIWALVVLNDSDVARAFS